MWGIPFQLFAPYVSVYMLALGLDDRQIGLIASISLLVQIFFSLLSGAITDKLGRKRTTFIYDIIAWSIPTLIWAFAQNFWYFVIAAVIAGVGRVTMISWQCLLVEDTEPEQIIDIYTWVYISGRLAVFFAPLAGLLIARFTLVPTVRGLYLLAFVLMTAKFFVLNRFVTETRQGKIRMQQTKDQPLFTLLREYRGVFWQILGTPQTLSTIGIFLVMSIADTINSSFWSIIVTRRIMIPEDHLALFPFARSLIALLFFFLVQPRIRHMKFRNPMVVGFAGFVVAQTLLVNVPEKNYVLLLISVLIEACSYATVGTQLDRMVVLTVDPQERARIMSIIYVVVISLASPFGYIAGQLSSISRILPFLLNIILFIVGGTLVLLAARLSEQKSQTAQALEA